VRGAIRNDRPYRDLSDQFSAVRWGHTFAFVRKSRLPGYFSDTGGLEELAAVLAMSRLIRPTTMGIRNAARVAIVNGKVKRILAYQPRGALVDAFQSKQNDQDWLGVSDAQRLKLLMPWITTKELMPRRIHNAYWHHEYAVRTYYVDHRWSFVCTGLEALVMQARTAARISSRTACADSRKTKESHSRRMS